MRVRQHACFLVVVSLFLASCSARYDVLIDKNGSAKADVSVSLGARTSAVIANVARSSAAAQSPTLDAGSVSAALKASRGISSVALKNIDSRSISGSVAVSRFDSFLSSRFVRVENSQSGGRVTVSFDRSSAPEVLASLSPEISDYLSALMAPVVTGEKLGNEEYLALVASVYGAGVAQEIRTAKVAFSLRLPGQAVSVKGGAASGDKADFSLPLLDFLTLEKPVRLEAQWR